MPDRVEILCMGIGMGIGREGWLVQYEYIVHEYSMSTSCMSTV
jgi:hypothetical protein